VTYKEYVDEVGVRRGFCGWCGGGVVVGQAVVAGSLDEPAAVLEGVEVRVRACGEL
jgi:hypothetical protein